MKKIVVIATGGTILSKVDYETGGVKPIDSIEELLRPLELDLNVKIEFKKPFLIDSSCMRPEHWIKLAKEVEKELNKREVSGIVILHGTDTLTYTASALAFMLSPLNKPVVFTYAMRSLDRGSSDAYLNFKNALIVALSDIAEVTILGHASSDDETFFVLRAVKTRKMHASRRDAFRPINCLPIAKITEGKIEYTSNYNKRNEKEIKAETFFGNVSLIKFYPGLKPETLNLEKVDGVVIEAYGLGQIDESWLKYIEKLIKGGKIVCFVPQTIYGRLDENVYAIARKFKKIGVIFLKDMLSEVAFVKLGWLLGMEKNKEKIKELMLENLRGEFSEKETYEMFLY